MDTIEISGVNRRAFITGAAAAAGGAAVAATESVVQGSFAEVSWAERERDRKPVVPAGAKSVVNLDRRCVGCGKCVAACPSQCLRLSDTASGFGRVRLDFRYGWCRPECVRCGQACPTGAIAAIGFDVKRDTHVGSATWRKDLCLRVTEGVDCHACEKHCPVKAVKLVNGVPVVNRDACVGCGACEHYCPVRPKVAIFVSGYAAHRTVRPLAEADLLAEMSVVLEGGAACVVARGGVIVASPKGRGVKPLLDLLAADPEALRGATVMDKVSGRAAAAICVFGGARKVCAPVMSKDAKAYLEQHGVAVDAKTVVPRIENRDHTGNCPMDTAIEGVDSPAEIVRLLRQAVRDAAK